LSDTESSLEVLLFPERFKIQYAHPGFQVEEIFSTSFPKLLHMMSSDTPGLILYDSVAVFLCFVAICQCFPKTAKCSVTRIARNILYVGLLEMLFFLEEIKIQVFRLARSVALFF
jgi:hypothetical protein